jgi:ABC-type Na+ efflux pump permease subunit
MFLRMIQKEIVQHVLSLRFAVTFVLFIVLIFASVFVTTNEFVRQREQRDSISAESKKRLIEICAMEETDDAVRTLAYWEGKTDVIPVSPYSWFGQGMQASYPPAVVTKANRVSRPMERGGQVAEMGRTTRIPDFVYVVNVVLSLLAILLLFDSVCGEKEAGTLRLMLTNAVPRAQVLLAKWIGGYIVLLVPFLLATTGAVVYALAKGAFTSDQTGRVLFLVLTACLYIAVFFNISLFISTTTSRSATSLLVCLLVWVMAVLVVPNMAPVTAQILAPRRRRTRSRPSRPRSSGRSISRSAVSR